MHQRLKKCIKVEHSNKTTIKGKVFLYKSSLSNNTLCFYTYLKIEY